MDWRDYLEKWYWAGLIPEQEKLSIVQYELNEMRSKTKNILHFILYIFLSFAFILFIKNVFDLSSFANYAFLWFVMLGGVVVWMSMTSYFYTRMNVPMTEICVLIQMVWNYLLIFCLKSYFHNPMSSLFYLFTWAMFCIPSLQYSKRIEMVLFWSFILVLSLYEVMAGYVFLTHMSPPQMSRVEELSYFMLLNFPVILAVFANFLGNYAREKLMASVLWGWFLIFLITAYFMGCFLISGYLEMPKIPRHLFIPNFVLLTVLLLQILWNRKESFGLHLIQGVLWTCYTVMTFCILFQVSSFWLGAVFNFLIFFILLTYAAMRRNRIFFQWMVFFIGVRIFAFRLDIVNKVFMINSHNVMAFAIGFVSLLLFSWAVSRLVFGKYLTCQH